jgi:hypothetical protein
LQDDCVLPILEAPPSTPKRALYMNSVDVYRPAATRHSSDCRAHADALFPVRAFIPLERPVIIEADALRPLTLIRTDITGC